MPKSSSGIASSPGKGAASGVISTARGTSTLRARSLERGNEWSVGLIARNEASPASATATPGQSANAEVGGGGRCFSGCERPPPDCCWEGAERVRCVTGRREEEEAEAAEAAAEGPMAVGRGICEGSIL